MSTEQKCKLGDMVKIVNPVDEFSRKGEKFKLVEHGKYSEAWRGRNEIGSFKWIGELGVNFVLVAQSKTPIRKRSALISASYTLNGVFYSDGMIDGESIESAQTELDECIAARDQINKDIAEQRKLFAGYAQAKKQGFHPFVGVKSGPQ